ncbi:D-alanyl-D-alanine carboxypeptidase/D-alanyl-D-alanine endopeptidase [Sphingomonas colocasiae]|uniref:D-alanyl-D-alanine carboxypeptidase/D-alanyl-D-alanine-endopeptidase n=1 Tax=Sphingomonas colocasiae TaxID=1848973 RepID=A0ABS7PIY5_9SPHN|nr:D-alanyl-D-alanine carboxypeptidase/D-alanyl-D-alanine-endopeptidase [Sphingomonas colocasiae]MBY8821257.1 D-alanyl-D-alanine carboxypeptidase/D-alanyl-D-alanine-endopeptidase [Sphingomonas colocasiae]
MTLLRRTFLGFSGVALVSSTVLHGQDAISFESRFEEIRKDPAFIHSLFGVAIYSLDRKQLIYSWNGETLMDGASTTKVVAVGAGMALLGPDYRFRTPVYRTGPIRSGVLQGDLILVGRGDANLSSRVRDRDSLIHVDEDHSYGGYDAVPLPGNPVQPLVDLARQVAAAGIKRIEGRVIVDASLFPEGTREVGSGATISPITVNDNMIDLVVHPGQPGAPAQITASLRVPYIGFDNQIRTSATGSPLMIRLSEKRAPDGNIRVTLSGQIPAGAKPYLQPYFVASPSRFATALFTQELSRAGIALQMPASADDTGAGAELKRFYTPENRVAEFVSPPFSEDAKVILKVSHNLHATLIPFITGSLVAGKPELAETRGPEARGFTLARKFIASRGLDLSGAVHSHGNGSSLFSPKFLATYLAAMTEMPFFAKFRDGLPVFGKDGTLGDALPNSPATGRIVAKTGTSAEPDLLNDGYMLKAKGLAGYTTTPSGERVAFAVLLNRVPIDARVGDGVAMREKVRTIGGNTVARIAEAINLYPIRSPR